jgi:hypothetical protein
LSDTSSFSITLFKAWKEKAIKSGIGGVGGARRAGVGADENGFEAFLEGILV